jgi:hypothetical protein
MLWTIFVILLILWALGMVSGSTMGGFIHLLLILAVVVVLVRIIQGGAPFERHHQAIGGRRAVRDGARVRERRARAPGRSPEPCEVQFGTWPSEDGRLQLVCRVETRPATPFGAELQWRWWSPLLDAPKSCAPRCPSRCSPLSAPRRHRDVGRPLAGDPQFLIRRTRGAELGVAGLRVESFPDTVDRSIG